MDLNERVLNILNEIMPNYQKKSESEWAIALYADYRDKMEYRTAIEIFDADNPEDAFYDQLDYWYLDYQYDEIEEIVKSVIKKLDDDDVDDDDVRYIVRDCVYCEFPADHYLNQEFRVPIMVDTGDGNYDYILNCITPAWNGCSADAIDDKASLVWLCQQQGYKKCQLQKVINSEDKLQNKFLDSVYDELANESGSMNTLTFLVTMTLQQLVNLNAAIKKREGKGHFYDASERSDCGTITISKNTFTGLFDPWNGGGSLFDIVLDTDVVLPIKFIRSALPDGGDGYGVDNVYGWAAQAWRGEVKGEQYDV